MRGRRRLLTGCFFQLAQCFSGSTVISFYVQPIFQDSIGLDQGLASLMSGYLQIWFLVASLGTWWLVEVSLAILYVFSPPHRAEIQYWGRAGGAVEGGSMPYRSVCSSGMV